MGQKEHMGQMGHMRHNGHRIQWCDKGFWIKDLVKLFCHIESGWVKMWKCDSLLNPRGQQEKKQLHLRKSFPEPALAVLRNLLMLVLWDLSMEDLRRRKADL